MKWTSSELHAEHTKVEAKAEAPALPEAPVSITLKATLHGHEVMVTLRGTDFVSVKTQVEQASEWLQAQGTGQTSHQEDKEHSVILTPFGVAVDGVQIPDRKYRYIWRSEVPTSHCRCTRTTMPQSA